MKKLLFLIVALVALSAGMQAQDAPTCDLQVGDSVMVNPDTTHYMTGEEIAPWVYTVKHAIQQVGSAFHPGGVLLQGIISWLHQSALLTDGTKPVAEEAIVEETVAEEVVAGEDVKEEAVAEEAVAEEDVAKETVVEEAVVEEAVVEEAVVEEADTQVAAKEVDDTEEVTAKEVATEVKANLPTRLVGRIVSSEDKAIEGVVITLANQGFIDLFGTY